METGDRIRVTRNDRTYEGILLPSSTSDHLVIKRSGGYNVGINRQDATVEVVESDVFSVEEKPDSAAEDVTEVTFDDSFPTISLLSTGGTIASTVDYRTGAVSPRFDVDDVLRVIPELQGRANYRGRKVANLLSENMHPGVWQELAEAIASEIEAGADGIVVMHGTDTMQYTASAIAFMIDTPVPIVFTGSQRSADRPSSDNVMNAVCAVEAAKGPIAESLICMHESESDDRCALHRGTRVRKNHTSRRDAFETVGQQPLGSIPYDDPESLQTRSGANYIERQSTAFSVASELNTNVELLKFTPGADVDRLNNLSDRDGLVIEGTGLGHVNKAWIDKIRQLIDGGTEVVMTSQCLEGRVCDRVYETGRDLLDAGVIEAEDTLPETGMVKLMWVLEHTSSVSESMGSSLAGERTAHSRPWT